MLKLGDITVTPGSLATGGTAWYHVTATLAAADTGPGAGTFTLAVSATAG
ncbi:hypothetical protein [Xylanimonas allomyrinae]|nr:hypothetical protein [Xylanimonas allomyrinae]